MQMILYAILVFWYLLSVYLFVVLYLFYGPCCLILNKWMDGWILYTCLDMDGRTD